MSGVLSSGSGQAARRAVCGTAMAMRSVAAAPQPVLVRRRVAGHAAPPPGCTAYLVLQPSSSSQARLARGCPPGVRCSASTSSSAAVELEEIDPVTGLVIPKLAATNPVAGLKVTVKGVSGGASATAQSWAYRRSDVAADKASDDKPLVLLVHGLGSSSWSYRATLGLLGSDGYDAIAPDWPGHGDSDKPVGAAAQQQYSEAALIAGLDAFLDAVGVPADKPIALVVQGFVLSQYALLWALANEGRVARLFILNTPLALGTKLRPELAAYKAPLAFMRPKSFDGMIFNATGSAYVMEGRVAEAYARPYADPAASVAVASVMERCDFNKLLAKVNEGFRTWRRPSVILFGGSDPFMNVSSAFEFLEDKRTNMKVVTSSAKLGHCPQEDFADAVHDSMLPWLTGQSDAWDSGMLRAMKMTKKGAVQV